MSNPRFLFYSQKHSLRPQLDKTPGKMDNALKTTPERKKWCRSRDLNPDERNSLPPQDSVSTMFHHFGIFRDRGERIRLPIAALSILLTPGGRVCQHENHDRSNPNVIWSFGERSVQVCRSRPLARVQEMAPPAAAVGPAPPVSRLRPWRRRPSTIFPYGPPSKIRSVR